MAGETTQTDAAAKAAAEKAAAEKAAAEKAAADKAAAGSGVGGGSVGDADFTSGANDGEAGGKGSAGSAGAGTGGGPLDLKLAIPDDLKDRVPMETGKYLQIAKEEKLSQKALDRLAGVFFESARTVVNERDEDLSQAVKEVAADWRREIIQDATLGGSMDKARASFQVALKGARALGGETLARAFKAYMDGTSEEPISGPALMRAFHRAGLAELEDHLGEQPAGGGREQSTLSAEQRRMNKRYPSLQESAGRK